MNVIIHVLSNFKDTPLGSRKELVTWNDALTVPRNKLEMFQTRHLNIAHTKNYCAGTAIKLFTEFSSLAVLANPNERKEIFEA